MRRPGRGESVPPMVATATAQIGHRAPRAVRAIPARRLLVPAIALVGVVVAGLTVRGPASAIAGALDRALSADPCWVVAGVLFEVVSFAGYVALLWHVAGRAAPRVGLRVSYQVTLAGAAATRLLPTAGAGGAALTLWALRRAGARDRAGARTLLTFLVVLYAVFLLAVAVSGAVVATGPGGLPGAAFAQRFAGAGGRYLDRHRPRARDGRAPSRGHERPPLPLGGEPPPTSPGWRQRARPGGRRRDGARPWSRRAPARRTALVGIRHRGPVGDVPRARIAAADRRPGPRVLRRPDLQPAPTTRHGQRRDGWRARRLRSRRRPRARRGPRLPGDRRLDASPRRCGRAGRPAANDRPLVAGGRRACDSAAERGPLVLAVAVWRASTEAGVRATLAARPAPAAVGLPFPFPSRSAHASTARPR